MLELKHISYVVREGDGELGILKDISLTIDDHKLVVFTGPNGGGKTTLAKIVMGLAQPRRARSSGTARTSPTWGSRSGRALASATAFSSRPASRG